MTKMKMKKRMMIVKIRIKSMRCLFRINNTMAKIKMNKMKTKGNRMRKKKMKRMIKKWER